MITYRPHDALLLDNGQDIVTTPFLLDILDSALIENIQRGNIAAAYGVLDLSISLAQTLEGNTLTEDEGKQILSRVKAAMKRGNIATAKQHMVEFVLR
jgi:selenophosphate synthase